MSKWKMPPGDPLNDRDLAIPLLREQATRFIGKVGEEFDLRLGSVVLHRYYIDQVMLNNTDEEPSWIHLVRLDTVDPPYDEKNL